MCNNTLKKMHKNLQMTAHGRGEWDGRGVWMGIYK